MFGSWENKRIKVEEVEKWENLDFSPVWISIKCKREEKSIGGLHEKCFLQSWEEKTRRLEFKLCQLLICPYWLLFEIIKNNNIKVISTYLHFLFSHFSTQLNNKRENILFSLFFLLFIFFLFIFFPLIFSSHPNKPLLLLLLQEISPYLF